MLELGGRENPTLEPKGKRCQICPRIQLQSLWFMSPLKWGATWLATDLRIQEPCIECPWGE